jgi:hypothetical protein
MISTDQKKAFSAVVVIIFSALTILVIDEELNSLSGLSLNLGDGKCEWKSPLAVVPEDIDLWKTLLVGFPSG